MNWMSISHKCITQSFDAHVVHSSSTCWWQMVYLSKLWLCSLHGGLIWKHYTLSKFPFRNSFGLFEIYTILPWLTGWLIISCAHLSLTYAVRHTTGYLLPWACTSLMSGSIQGWTYQIQWCLRERYVKNQEINITMLHQYLWISIVLLCSAAVKPACDREVGRWVGWSSSVNTSRTAATGCVSNCN
jgi:hypothetical protein